MRRPLPGEAGQPRLERDLLPTPRAKIRGAQGNELDASFSLEADHADAVSILFESRGGTRGSSGARNVDYAEGLEVLLGRLARRGAAILDILLDTQRTRDLSIGERRIRPPGFTPYPIRLAGVDCSALRRAISRAQGNNPTRRIRIATSLRARGDEIESLLQFLAQGRTQD